MSKRGALRAFTIALLAATAWTAYANVLSDDTEVRARSQATARAAAGCGDACRLVNMEGDRGMISHRVAYTFDGKGMVVVTCRRPFVLAGEHACEASRP